MTRFKKIALIPVLFMAGCSSGSGEFEDLSKVPILEINATHAISIEQSARGLSFVPNNVAPWLGRLILENSDLSLSSTDIEGRTPQKVSEREYKQTFGLARENESGVFLALNQNTNKLEAFIEADDQGNFIPLSYSGGDLSPRAFCSTNRALQDSASVISSPGGVKSLSISIPNQVDSMNAPVEQIVVQEIAFGETVKYCSVNEKNTYAYTNDGNNAYLHTYDAQNSEEFITDETSVTKDISALTQLTLNDITYILMLKKGHVLLFNTQTNKLEYKIEVKSGLSISGLEKTKFIATTTHNFGGAAFSEGLVAFGQADEDRIVFVSRSYLADIVKGSKS